MAAGFPTKANWVSGDILTAAAQDDLAGTVNLLSNASATSGDVLVSNVAGTSFAYQPNRAAGKNAVINGGMDIWQRGTSVAVAASSGATYTADRFATYTGVGQALTVSRQPTADTTNLPNIQYCARYQRNSGQTGVGGLNFAQSIESTNSIPFAGKTVILSFYARAGANYSSASNALGVNLVSGTGTDQQVLSAFTGQASVATGTATLTTTWQRFTYSGTVATTATQLGLITSFTPVGTAGANDYYEITGVQLELGSVATTFSRAGGTLQGELAACQRYYYRNTPGTSFYVVGSGLAKSTTVAAATIKLPTTMRVVPTSLDYSSLALWDGVTNTNSSSSVLNGGLTGSTDYGQVELTVAAGLTQFRPYIVNTSASTGYVGFSAEL